MIRITRKEIDSFDRIYRLNLINSVTGYKPVNLIGTISNTGITNLAIVSSVIHLGSNPPLIGFIQRPVTVQRDTYENIRQNGYYTINHVHGQFIDKAHQTSAKYASDESEFNTCGFKEEYLHGFLAPFVMESKIRIGLKLIEEVVIRHNGTILMIGEILEIHLAEQCLEDDGSLDLNVVNDVCISGLNTYHAVSQKATFAYARPTKAVELLK